MLMSSFRRVGCVGMPPFEDAGVDGGPTYAWPALMGLGPLGAGEGLRPPDVLSLVVGATIDGAGVTAAGAGITNAAA